MRKSEADVGRVCARDVLFLTSSSVEFCFLFV